VKVILKNRTRVWHPIFKPTLAYFCTVTEISTGVPDPPTASVIFVKSWYSHFLFLDVDHPLGQLGIFAGNLKFAIRIHDKVDSGLKAELREQKWGSRGHPDIHEKTHPELRG